MSAYLEVKQQLLLELEALPEYRLSELLTFIKFLQYQEGQTRSLVDGDPLHAFIGGVSHGSLAQQIDEDIYS